jgi:hypothetical protein
MADASSSTKFVDMEQRLHEAAARDVGCDDFGEQSYREGLRVLLAAYDQEAKLTPFGRKAAQIQLTEILKKRLRAEKAWRENPEILQQDIRRPIVILGLVRTGSTALHYLMGQDPGIQPLPYWLACNPQARPPRAEWESQRDFRSAAAEIDFMYQADPSLKAIHFMRADLPEECRHLLAQSFTDDGFEVCATVPSYSAWYEAKHLKETYLRHRKLIQLIGSTDPERRWLLKYPVHMRHLQAFLEVYPDACIVQTHRDPTTVFRSYCNLVASFRSLYEADVDREDITRKQLELWAAGAEEAIEVRRQHNAAQFYDLYFSDFMGDPVGSVKSIYRHFGQTLSEDGERKLVEWDHANPQAKHGKHDYERKETGVTDSEILDRFATYMDHFDMKPERRNA